MRRRVDVDAARAVNLEGFDGRHTNRGVPNRRMLDVGVQDRRAGLGGGGAEDRRVDRLGRTRGEHHLAWYGAEQCRHLTAGLLERVADEAGFLVEATRVGCGPPGPRQDRSERLGSRRGGAGVVEIGASHRGSGRGGAGVVAPGPRGQDHRQRLV